MLGFGKAAEPEGDARAVFGTKIPDGLDEKILRRRVRRSTIHLSVEYTIEIPSAATKH